MVETTLSSSSSSSCASCGSFDDVAVKSGGGSVKFLCSYGGKILPRYPDGKLRYFGGDTRVLAVDRSVPFSELQAKLGELCGWSSFSLRCQLPNEDLDALVSITSDEDLANLIEEYDLSNGHLKIRSFLFETPPQASKPSKSPSPPRAPSSTARPRRCVHHHQHQHHNQICLAPSRFSGGGRPARDARLCDAHHHRHPHHEHGNHRYIVHH